MSKIFNNNKFIPVAEPSFDASEMKNVVNCVKTGWISSLGKYIGDFEREYAKFNSTKYAISTSNGTTALHIILVALGIGKGDEVIVPSFTFIATANAVAYTGAKPIFVDSEEDSWNINPRLIERKINSRTRAIIPVHIYGHPAKMDEILAIAKKHNLYVVEDAAEAHGALFMGKRVGSLGIAGCFSFYGNKIITTGEGGMVVTDSKKLANKISFLKDHAMSTKRKYYHPEIGFNYRMTNIQAAIGLAQLKKINKFIKKKIQIAKWYTDELKGLNNVILPPKMSWAKNVYWMYSILLKDNSTISRDKLISELKIRGIDSRPFFYPIHKMPPYLSKDTLSVSEMLSRCGINLPSATTLTKQQVVYIARNLKDILMSE